QLIVEEDIVEVVYDDQFTLAARIPKKLRTTSLGIFTEAGPVNFSNVVVHRLKNLEAIPIPTSTTVSASTSNSIYGTAVTFTARVAPWTNGPPTGNVVFTIDGAPQSPVPLTAQGTEGVASLSIASLSVNGGMPHSITAQFTGSAGHEPSSGSLPGGHRVLPKPLAITGLTAANKVYDGNTAATLVGTAQLLPAIPMGSGSAHDGRPYT
ncbi:MAG: Ig-like domain repeat protein, partial [Verrucomicrobiae bacterium]|nr:Ig-like domain repeat protein [Verrucomicrobiae bacterium]